MTDLVFGVKLDGSGDLAETARDANAELGKLNATSETLRSHSASVSSAITNTSGEINKFSGAAKNAALSAGELRMATRQLPMQFTDIFVGLASGQSPMMVLLQQGGQLKDMFGGVGNAAKAMGGYVMSLINPITLVTAAVAAGAYAWYNWGEDVESAAEKAKRAIDEVTHERFRLDAIALQHAELAKQIPTAWLSYSAKELAQLDENSQEMVKLYKDLDRKLIQARDASDDRWAAMYATEDQKRLLELQKLERAYAEQQTLHRGNAAELEQIRMQHLQKMAELDRGQEKKQPKDRHKQSPEQELAEFELEQIGKAADAKLAEEQRYKVALFNIEQAARDEKKADLKATSDWEINNYVQAFNRKLEIQAMGNQQLAAMLLQGKLAEQDIENMSMQQKIGTTLQGFSQLLAGAGQHSIAMFNVSKAIALAEGAIKLPETIMTAYAAGSRIGGPPIGAAFAAVAGAAQLINLNAIRNAQFGGGGGSAPSGGGGGLPGQVANPDVVAFRDVPSVAAQPRFQNNDQPGVTSTATFYIDARGSDNGVVDRIRQLFPALIAENKRVVVGVVNQMANANGKKAVA